MSIDKIKYLKYDFKQRSNEEILSYYLLMMELLFRFALKI